MNTCCPNTSVPFSNVSESNIPYTGEYGLNPTVTVVYKVGTVWTIKGVINPIQLQGNPVDNIYVDHGETSTGIIKIS